MIKRILLLSQLTKHSLALLAMIIRISSILPPGFQLSCASQAQPPGTFSTLISTRWPMIKSGKGMRASITCGGYTINALMHSLYDRSSQIPKPVKLRFLMKGR